VTDNPATTDQGSWQYSLNASDWFNIDSVGETTALLLDRDTFIRFTPAADFHGNPAVLSIRAVDGTFTGDFSTDTANRLLLDTVTAGNMVSAEHAIAITILPVNDAPQGEDNRIDIPEDTPYSYSAADFGFSDLADGDSFRGVTVITLPANGTLSLNGTPVNANDWIPVTDLDIGILTYTPEAQDNREDSWSFAVSDDGGRVNNGEDQDQSDNTITMNIMPVNDAPAGRNDIIELNEDNTLILDASTFGFSDDSDGHSLAGVIITAPSAQGSLLHNGSAVSNNAFINTSDLEAGILFKVVDTGPADIGENTSTENTLTINVNPVNDTPTLSIEDNLQVEENSSANSIGSVATTDADSDDIHFFSINDDRFEVVNGAISLKPEVTLDFEAEPLVPLQITVTDSGGASATQDIVLQVLDINEAPVPSETLTNQTDVAPFSFALPESLFSG